MKKRLQSKIVMETKLLKKGKKAELIFKFDFVFPVLRLL